MATTVIDAIRMTRSAPDAIIAAGELVDMRFKSGSALSLRAAKLFCLLILSDIVGHQGGHPLDV